MAQAKHVCTELIDQAALNAAELMTKTTNAILHPCNWIRVFVRVSGGARTQPARWHAAHLGSLQRRLRRPPPSSCRLLAASAATRFQMSTDVKLLYN